VEEERKEKKRSISTPPVDLINISNPIMVSSRD
jgi:hypothetical protein